MSTLHLIGYQDLVWRTYKAYRPEPGAWANLLNLSQVWLFPPSNLIQSLPLPPDEIRKGLRSLFDEIRTCGTAHSVFFLVFFAPKVDMGRIIGKLPVEAYIEETDPMGLTIKHLIAKVKTLDTKALLRLKTMLTDPEMLKLIMAPQNEITAAISGMCNSYRKTLETSVPPRARDQHPDTPKQHLHKHAQHPGGCQKHQAQKQSPEAHEQNPGTHKEHLESRNISLELQTLNEIEQTSRSNIQTLLREINQILKTEFRGHNT